MQTHVYLFMSILHDVHKKFMLEPGRELKYSRHMTTAEYANELLSEAKANNEPSPYRAAFVDSLNARGTDRRTKQFKHYDKIIKWMITNWATELE